MTTFWRTRLRLNNWIVILYNSNLTALSSHFSSSPTIEVGTVAYKMARYGLFLILVATIVARLAMLAYADVTIASVSEGPCITPKALTMEELDFDWVSSKQEAVSTAHS